MLTRSLCVGAVLLALSSGACSTAQTATVEPAAATQEPRPVQPEVTPTPLTLPGTPGTATVGPAIAAPEARPAQPEMTPAPQPSESAARGGGLPQDLRWVAPSLVRVRADGREGTGFVAFQPDQVLTAFHVLGNASVKPTVIASDGAEYEAALVGVDQDADLALLSVPKRQAPLLIFASGSGLGEAVVEIGYAAGGPGEVSPTRSTILAKPQDPQTGLVFLQVDGPRYPGTGGSPLLNEQGRVVGMSVARPPVSRAQDENQRLAVATEAILRLAAGLRTGTVSVPAVPAPAPGPPGPATGPIGRGLTSGASSVVREYAEERTDGGLYLVQQWSDGRFTTPMFLVFESGTNPIKKPEARVLSYLTRPGSSCETRLPEAPPRRVVAEADAHGRIWTTWYVPEGLTKGTVLFISVSCKYGSARLYTTQKVSVEERTTKGEVPQLLERPEKTP